MLLAYLCALLSWWQLPFNVGCDLRCFFRALGKSEMLLAVFVCTYFKKKKKKAKYIFWHCKIALLSVIPYCWPLSQAGGHLVEKEMEWAKGALLWSGQHATEKCHQVYPKTLSSQSSRKTDFESFSVLFLKFSCWDSDDCLRVAAERFFWTVWFWGGGDFSFFWKAKLTTVHCPRDQL